MRLWSWVLSLISTVCCTACVSPTEGHYGVQDEHLANIPAQIAVLPCQLWPQNGRFPGQNITEVPNEAVQALCQQWDAFILKGFERQPYMRGLGPRVVKALLDKNKQAVLLTQLESLWFHSNHACSGCRHPASFYKSDIAARPEWRQWLSQLSRATRNSDAILLPLILELSSKDIDDRGLFYAQRKASISLLLIDSNNGSLIWIGGRSTETRRPLIKSPEGVPAEAYAPWADLWTQLLVVDLWREFPGRQN